MSHTLYPGSIISKTAPTVTPPTNGEGGSASGIWTLDQADYYISQGTWPLPPIQGGLWNWGANNSYGQLGFNNLTNYSSPKQVGSLTNWSKISFTGDNKTIAWIKSDGTLWTCGYGGFGALGLGNTTDYSSPKQVGALTNWLSISCGYKHMIAVKTDGSLWAWGNNFNGQLGLGNSTNYSSPKQVGALTSWLNVSASGYSSVAIKTDGSIWSWGYGGSGQLGHNNINNYSSPKQIGSLTNWSKIITGASQTYALKNNGTFWSWGTNAQGQLGLGNITDYSSPKQVGALTNWAMNGFIYGGFGGIGTVKTDGTLWTWGVGTQGRLGLGNTNYYSSPKQVGALTNWSLLYTGIAHMAAIKTDGTLWTWGNNANGELGLSNTFNYSSPKQVGSSTNWKKGMTGQRFCSFIRS